MATTARKASSTAKAFVTQVQAALRSSARPTPTLHGIDCSRLWVQVRPQFGRVTFVGYTWVTFGGGDAVRARHHRAQGVVVARDVDVGECALDDGTGIALVDMKVFLKNTPPGLGALPGKGACVCVVATRRSACDARCSYNCVGEYVMVIGPLQKKLMQQQGSDAPLRLLAHQVVQLDAKQQREAVWFLEVVEYWTSVAARDAAEHTIM
ncbi:hypothetical protein PybrP1_010955 [[Pythium] brassicae (nom. inval.)]|nr:hypothetical protein PybrP1_010955 [[Pythium] brassicae (nom. inval.)]